MTKERATYAVRLSISCLQAPAGRQRPSPSPSPSRKQSRWAAKGIERANDKGTVYGNGVGCCAAGKTARRAGLAVGTRPISNS